jgi:hypothetical protein
MSILLWIKIKNKIYEKRAWILLIIIVISIILTSFSFGYLMGTQKTKNPIIIKQNIQK